MRRYRRLAPGCAWSDHRLPNTTNPLWERACSRKRCISQHFWRLTHRLREQARSHIGPRSVRPASHSW
ncbi:hypothetical protein CD175_03585 [Pseudomonas laurylsulfatiphila]|uniref:Uncharacterized protein n=1 Tax=Pseudomonas laurylsulfatiphila TaxID=2011015 RepID=A0A2S6FSY5_9PSED|nr:hypothetical protein CD175_03585 [Pseudomonas laurylsulfatiphila]